MPVASTQNLKSRVRSNRQGGRLERAEGRWKRNEEPQKGASQEVGEFRAGGSRRVAAYQDRRGNRDDGSRKKALRHEPGRWGGRTRPGRRASATKRPGLCGTCWRLLLQTQCCQPPSAPLESRQEVQLGRRWHGVGQGRGGEDSTGIGDTLSSEWLKQVQS